MATTELRAAIQTEMGERRRGWSRRVDALQFEINRLTATLAVNERRAAAGQDLWSDRVEFSA